MTVLCLANQPVVLKFRPAPFIYATSGMQNGAHDDCVRLYLCIIIILLYFIIYLTSFRIDWHSSWPVAFPVSSGLRTARRIAHTLARCRPPGSPLRPRLNFFRFSISIRRWFIVFCSSAAHTYYHKYTCRVFPPVRSFFDADACCIMKSFWYHR